MLVRYSKIAEGEAPPRMIEVVTDPAAIAAHRAGTEAFRKNVAWYDANIDELAPKARGKHLAVAGGEAFIADTFEEVRAWVEAKHPDDLGPYFESIPAVDRERA